MIGIDRNMKVRIVTMSSNKNQISSKETSFNNFHIDMGQFLHINVDKEKMKDELEDISDYNNIYG